MGLRYYKAVWASSNAKGTAKLVMLALAECANENTGQCNPSHETLAGMVGVTTRQIRKILDDLATAGEIEIITGRGRNHTNQYNILLENRNSSSGYKPENRNSSASETGTGVPILDDKIGTPAQKIGTPARENRNWSSYEPIEPIEPMEVHSEREGSASAPPPTPAKKLVPHKPHFGTNGATSKPAKPKIETDSPHIDPQKFRNGYIPAGTGSTPVEVFYERHSIRDHRITAPVEDDLARTVTDLDRWRETVTAWQQAGYKPGNIGGQLEWYRDGIPGRRRWQDRSSASGRPAAGSAPGHAGSPNGKPGGGDVSEQFRLDEVKLTAQLVNRKIDDAEYERQYAALRAAYGLPSLQRARALPPS